MRVAGAGRYTVPIMTTKNIARWVAIGALFLIPFLSLYVANGLYFPFITGKNFAFRVLVEIAFASWIVLAISDRRYRPRFSWTYAWYKSFVFWMLIADLTAVNVHKALWSNYERMDGWVTLIHLLILLVVMGAVLSTENLWRKWWLAFVAGSGIVTLYGIGQMLGLFGIHQGSTRIDATLGNAEYLAGYLLFAIAIALWQAFETRAKDQAWLKYSLIALAAVELVVLFATGTRGTLIALIVAAVVGSVLWILETGKKGRKGAVAILAVIVVLVGGLFVFRDASFVQNNPNVQRLASVFSLKQALGPRITIWHMAVEGIQEKPILGWGQDGYNYVFNQFYEPHMYSQEPWFDRAHNMFLDWSIAGGIPALLLFLAALITAIIALYRAPVSRGERIMLLSALAGYSVQGLVVFDNLFTYMPFIAIIAMAHMVSSRPVKMIENAHEINDTRLDTIVGPMALVFGLLLIWFVNVPSVLAGSDLIAGLTPSNAPDARFASFKESSKVGGLGHQEITEQLMSFASGAVGDNSLTQSMREDIAKYAEQEMSAELERAPKDTRLHLQYALFLRSIGDVKGAQAESAIARTLSPKKQSVLIEQGIEAFLLPDYAAAKEYFMQAYQLDTEYKDPLAYAAATAIAQKDIAGGKALLQQGFGTTTVNHPMLVLAYYQIHDWNDLILIVQQKLRETNDVNTGFQLAAAYSQAGRRQDAIAQVRATIAAHPEAAADGVSLLEQLGATQ